MNTVGPVWPRVLRWLVRLAVIIVFAYLAHLLLGWVEARVADRGAAARAMVTMSFFLAYALVIAVPFVPGVELAISFMLMRGPEVAPLVYVATVIGLALAYLVGRFVPYRWLQRASHDLGLHGLDRSLAEIAGLSRHDRLNLLRDRLPRRLRWVATKFRYVMIAALVNLPGSTLIGGGGGILMLAGLSRLFGFSAILITLILAVAPVPALVWVFGIDVLK